ncbi:MAG: InlB B-repeat-containing protein [Defluviitaleaceae bacterium]|nr:InlB B-repeat-containing protein [Defluviitaleaceae bacterium]
MRVYIGDILLGESQPIILNVVESLPRFTTTFEPNGGIRVGGGELTQFVNIGGNAILPIVERGGYTFAGWHPEGAYNNVTSARTITAQWTVMGGSVVNAAPAVPGFTRRVPGSAPGTAASSFSTGMSSARRAATDIRRDVSNDTTAEGVLADIRASLPSGVTAEWSPNTPFALVPATAVSDGRITGLVIISAGSYRSAISFNTLIPALEAEPE